MNWSGIAQNAAAAVATGGLTLLTTYSQTHNWETSAIAGGAALCSYVLSRLGVAGAVSGAKASLSKAA